MDKSRSLLFSLLIPSVLLAVGHQGLMLLLPLYVLELEGSAGSAAAIVGMRGVGMMLIDIPAGMLATRFGDKKAMLAALSCVLVTTLAFAFVVDWYGLVLITLLYGIGVGAWLTARLSYVTDTCESTIRGRVIAALAGAMRAGAIIGPLLAGLTAKYFSFAAAFFVVGALTLGAMLFIALFARNVPAGASEGTPHLDRLVGVIVSHRRTLATAGSSALAITLLRAARQLLIPLYGAALGIDAAAIGLIFSLSMAIDLALFYPAGLLMDRRGRKWAAVPCAGLLALSLVLLPLAQGFTGLLLVALLAGVANGLGTGVVMTLGSDLSPPGRRGEFLGVWRLLSDLGLAGGPLLIGVLSHAGGLAVATFSVAGIGLIGMFVLLFHVQETLEKRTRHR
ncbi:MAG: MFS transporter [Gammaproteobacteria bacterium]